MHTQCPVWQGDGGALCAGRGTARRLQQLQVEGRVAGIVAGAPALLALAGALPRAGELVGSEVGVGLREGVGVAQSDGHRVARRFVDASAGEGVWAQEGAAGDGDREYRKHPYSESLAFSVARRAHGERSGDTRDILSLFGF